MESYSLISTFLLLVSITMVGIAPELSTLFPNTLARLAMDVYHPDFEPSNSPFAIYYISTVKNIIHMKK